MIEITGRDDRDDRQICQVEIIEMTCRDDRQRSQEEMTGRDDRDDRQV